jgi:hypothetical protein
VATSARDRELAGLAWAAHLLRRDRHLIWHPGHPLPGIPAVAVPPPRTQPGAPYLWYDPAFEDSEMVPLDGAVWEADLAAWQAECQASRKAAAPSDAVRYTPPSQP